MGLLFMDEYPEFERRSDEERLSIRLNRMLNKSSYGPPVLASKIKKADRVVLSVFADLQDEWRHQRQHHVSYLSGSRQERKCWKRLIRHLTDLPSPQDS